MQKKNRIEVEKNDNKKEIRIRCYGELTCKLWGREWGQAEHYLVKKDIIKINCVKLDISNCNWADPIPLLSILLVLYKIKSNNILIKIYLPRIMGSKDSDEYLKGKFLKFLATQGFLKIMLDHFLVYDCREKITTSKIKKYSNYRYTLSYSGAEVVQAQIYQVINKDTKIALINHIENEFKIRLKNSVSLQNYYMLSAQFHNIILELIENVEYHAYSENEEKIFGLYIRRRIGGSGEYPIDSKDMSGFVEELNVEKNNCPALDSEIMLGSDAVLEIFFVDIGMGMRGSLKEYYTNQFKKDYKYPIRELFVKVLKEGIRKKTSKITTPYGGLHFIAKILQENNGYIWCKEYNEWIGVSSQGLKDESLDTISVAVVNNDFHPRGIAWGFRVPFSFIGSKSTNIVQKWSGRSTEHPVFSKYQYLDNSLYIDRIICKDDRFGNTIWMNGESHNWQLDIEKKEDELKKVFGKISTYVWFPKMHCSKNSIIKNLEKYIISIISKTTPILENANIIILDIDSNEIVNYYYALNDLPLINIGYCNVERIVLVTKQWEVIVLLNENGKLICNKGIMKRFYEYNISNSNCICDNIQLTAAFIRKYDSYLFWSKIKEYEQEKIYINADIHWNNSLIIHGYLDFDRLYLYEELYLILKTALYRTKGLVNEANVEYRNIDSTSSRICQDLNAECPNQYDRNMYIINVGGASATGYTKESYYKESKVDMYVMFFAHPSLKRQLTATMFLFIWPEESFFSDFQKEKSIYYRLGKTNLITSNENEKLINIDSVYRNAERNKKQTYEDFSQKYPKFIKYGHYKTDNHHYLLGFDLITYMKFSYIKKEGAFVYILKRIISYLSDNNYNEIVSALKDKEWATVLWNYHNNEVYEHGELVVYHSNTVNEYIMKLIKNILPDHLLKRIISINIMEIQEKGSPITFSPFIMEKIKSHFESGQEGILYIDSSFSTGRKIMEIENILFESGCKKISFASIIDMRRIRNVDSKNKTYWKVNIPRLDDDSNCIICSTLKVLETFRDKVDSIANQRIQEWLRGWQCINMSSSINGHGIEAEEKYRYSFDGLGYIDSTMINIIAAENLCESYNNDFVYNYILKKTDLSVAIKIQLICTQICLYGNQTSRQLQLSLLSELIGCMAKYNGADSYTSLGGIVFISQSANVIFELLNEILYINKHKHILSIKKFLLETDNIDLIISLGYFVKNNYKIEKLLNGDPTFFNSRFVNGINRHLLPEKDLKLLCKEFQGLLINEQGRRHNTNMQKLLQDHVTDLKAFIEKCNNVKNDIYRMQELVKHFPLSMANSVNETSYSFSEIDETIKEVEFLMENDLKQAKIIQRKGEKRLEISEELRKALEECKKLFENILVQYFISYTDESKEYFEKRIGEYEKKYGKSVDLQIINNVGNNNKWYYWIRGIEKEFFYFLENLEHSFRCLDESLENEKYMSVNISFEYNNLLIKIQSWSTKTADLIKDKFRKENRFSKEQSYDFDVVFDFMDIKKNSEEGIYLLETIMSIPACYQQLKGGI